MLEKGPTETSASPRGFFARLLRREPRPVERAALPSAGARRRWWQWFGRKQNRRIQNRDSPVGPRHRSSLESRKEVVQMALAAVALAVAGSAVSGGFIGIHRFFTRSRHFAIHEIRVSPTTRVSADAIRARAGIALGDNLFSVSLEQLTQKIQADPWVASARSRRELPATIAIDVKEREAACVVALGSLYLADRRGEVFKRASPEEAAALPVVTGITRDGYVDDREASQALIREGLAALDAWRERPRPSVGEIHVDAATGITFYTYKDAIAIRFGHGDALAFGPRLARFDGVWRALTEKNEHPRLILVDQQVHTDRVIVSLAKN